MDPLSLIKIALTETGLLLSHHAPHIQEAEELAQFVLPPLAVCIIHSPFKSKSIIGGNV